MLLILGNTMASEVPRRDGVGFFRQGSRDGVLSSENAQLRDGQTASQIANTASRHLGEIARLSERLGQQPNITSNGQGYFGGAEKIGRIGASEVYAVISAQVDSQVDSKVSMFHDANRAAETNETNVTRTFVKK